MKKIIILFFLLFYSLFSSTKDLSIMQNHTENLKNNFSVQELQGIWVKIDCKFFKEFTNLIDIKEKKYQSIYFKENKYIGYSSNKKHFYNTKNLHLNFYKYELLNSNSINQWISFTSKKSYMYFSITKISKNNVIKKIINKKIYADFILGDMILSMYDHKTKRLVYRLQYRKIKSFKD